MPLDPLKYSDPIVRVYEACVDELLVNLAKHFSLASIGKTGSWEYEIMMLSKMGAIRKETAQIIAKRVANNEPMIVEAVKTAMLDALNEVEPDLKKAAKAGLLNDVEMDVMDGIQNQLTAYSRQARTQLNLVNTVMLDGTLEAYRKGVYAAVDIVKQMDEAQNILNVQTGKVVTGVATPQQALRAAVKAMADNGITGFVDHGGHKWSAEAYVRMDIKTTVSNAANRAVMDRNASYGNDIVWPRVNATARPGCYPWQGQLISMENRSRDVQDGNGKTRHVYAVSETTYGQPAGIWGINCHHGPMNVFIPGFSYVRGEQNKKAQEENDRLYQLTQEQRRLERNVRYAKRDAAMYDAAGYSKMAEKAKKRVSENQAKLRSFVNANESLIRSYDREYVFSFNSKTLGKTALPESMKGDIINPLSGNGGAKVQTVAKINLDAYRKVTTDIITDEVIITDKQVVHILEGHPEKEQIKVLERLSITVSDPDYILEDSHEEHKRDTAIAMKYFESETGGYRAIVRLATSSDDPSYKNSVITAFFVSEKKWKKYLRNKTIVYNRE